MIVRSRDDERGGDARVESEIVANSASFPRGHGRGGVHDHRCRAEGRRLGLNGFPCHQRTRRVMPETTRSSKPRSRARLPAQHAGALAEDGAPPRASGSRYRRSPIPISATSSARSRPNALGRADGVSLRYAGRSGSRTRRRPIAASAASRRHHPRAVAGPVRALRTISDRGFPACWSIACRTEVRSGGRRELQAIER